MNSSDTGLRICGWWRFTCGCSPCSSSGASLGQLIVVAALPRAGCRRWSSGSPASCRIPCCVGCQAVVLTLMIWISVDFSRGAGYWVEPHPRLGLVVLVVELPVLRRDGCCATSSGWRGGPTSDGWAGRSRSFFTRWSPRSSGRSGPITRLADVIRRGGEPGVAADVEQPAADVVVVPDEVQVGLLGADDAVAATGEAAIIELDRAARACRPPLDSLSPGSPRRTAAPCRPTNRTPSAGEFGDAALQAESLPRASRRRGGIRSAARSAQPVGGRSGSTAGPRTSAETRPTHRRHSRLLQPLWAARPARR